MAEQTVKEKKPATWTIWKLTLPDHPGLCTLAMPKGAQVLSVQAQADRAVLWALVDPEAEREAREFRMLLTGDEFRQEPLSHLGTVQLHDGRYVLHVFERAR